MTIYLIYGFNAIKNILLKNTTLIKKIYIFNLNYRVFKLIRIAENKNIKIHYCYSSNYNRFKYIRYAYHIIMQVVPIHYNHLNLKNFLKRPNISVLMLYKIQDPHNLASCIRSGEAFNFDFLILTKKDTAKITTLIHNISHATSLFLPIFIIKNTKYIITLLKKNDIKIIGLSIKAKQDISSISVINSFIIIMGSEKYGITSFIMKQCDFLCKISTYGTCDSINVSVATGIVLYYLKYRRLMTIL